MKQKTAKQLLEKVEADYKKIALDFSKTRKWLWPEFNFFKKYIKKNQTVIDFGCGNGRLYEFFDNVNYIGIDNNKKFIEIAQKNYPSTKFVFGNLIDFNSTYQADLIFSIAAFHHIPSNTLRKKSIQVFNKNLNNDGIVILTVWNLFQISYIKYVFKSILRFIIKFGKYDWNDTFIPWGKTGVYRYYHAFTPWELKKLFKNNGFDIIEMFYTRKSKKVNFLQSHNICLVCRKK